jgi:hypothetical protein
MIFDGCYLLGRYVVIRSPELMRMELDVILLEWQKSIKVTYLQADPTLVCRQNTYRHGNGPLKNVQ